jgi:hypothetical protein
MRVPSILTLSAALVLTGAAPRTAPAQNFEGEVGLKTPNGPVDASVKNGKARFTTTTPMGPAGIILDPTKGELNIIMDATRMVMVMRLDRGDSTSRDTTTTTVTPTGKSDTIAGHACEVFRFVGKTGATDICIASGLGNLGVSGLFGAGAAMGMGRTSAPSWVGALARRSGFPLRVADTTGAVSYEVTRVEAKPIADSLFVPPADYQRMTMPSFGRPPGGWGGDR